MKKITSLIASACALISASAVAQVSVTFDTTNSLTFAKTSVPGNAATGAYNSSTGHIYIPGASSSAPVFIQNPTTGADVGQLNLNSAEGDVTGTAGLGVFGMGTGSDGSIYGGTPSLAWKLVRWTTEGAVPTTATIDGAPSGAPHFTRVIDVVGTGASKRGAHTGSSDNGGFQILDLSDDTTNSVTVVSEMGNRVANSAIGKNGITMNTAVDHVWAVTLGGTQLVRNAVFSGGTWTEDPTTSNSASAGGLGLDLDETNNLVLGWSWSTDSFFALDQTTGDLLGSAPIGVNVIYYGNLDAVPTAGGGTAYWNARDNGTATTGQYGRIAYTVDSGINDWFVY